MNSGKISLNYAMNIMLSKFRLDKQYRRNINMMKNVEELEKRIKDLEHKERYSKNQMEKRNIRSQIGQLQRDLVVAKKIAKSNS